MGNISYSDQKCLLCNEINVDISADEMDSPFWYYKCPNCGKFFSVNQFNANYLSEEVLGKYDLSHLRSYLFYNKTKQRPIICTKAYFDKNVKEDYTNIYNLTVDMVESWYPQQFSEQIDKILLYFHSKTSYIGEKKIYKYLELKDIYFLKPINVKTDDAVGKQYEEQISYYNEFFNNSEYLLITGLGYVGAMKWGRELTISITPKGLARIEELQRNQKNNLNVFVAMKFGSETIELREKIKEGLEGFNVRIMDEIEHNHQIVPEMLYEIRNSRLVIAELSHHNNGAYYEAGYALGMGKEVIHICSKKELESGLHFDVSQVNTIIYDSIEEIPDKLKKRIKATIELLDKR